MYNNFEKIGEEDGNISIISFGNFIENALDNEFENENKFTNSLPFGRKYEIPLPYNKISEKQKVFCNDIIKVNKYPEDELSANTEPEIEVVINNEDNICSTSLKSKKVFKTKNLFNNKENNIKQNYINEYEKEKVCLGRKRKDCLRTSASSHDKTSDDNLTRKIKHMIIDLLIKFINVMLKVDYYSSFGTGENKKEFLKMGQAQIVNSKADYNRHFLRTTVKDIFSNKLSTKLKKYSPEHNINLIYYLEHENNKELREKYVKIFKLTFLECLEHFRGTKFIGQLEGMTNFNKYCENLEETPEYMKIFLDYVYNFEQKIQNKKSRNRPKKKKRLIEN